MRDTCRKESSVDTSYNVFIGCRTLNQVSAAISTPRTTMKFPTENDSIITMKIDQTVARQCYA